MGDPDVKAYLETWGLGEYVDIFKGRYWYCNL